MSVVAGTVVIEWPKAIVRISRYAHPHSEDHRLGSGLLRRGLDDRPQSIRIRVGRSESGLSPCSLLSDETKRETEQEQERWLDRQGINDQVEVNAVI